MKRRSAPSRPDDLIVFLGPSLPQEEALALAPCRVLPPARQGDVWRALSLHPRAIALVDGVFEAQPSVWHHELLAALDAGVAVFGGGSMGALRAAELVEHGVVGVGHIFEAYRRGELVDDSEVALLHADEEHGFRPLSVPLVNVRHAARQAQDARVLAPREARALVDAAAALFYQDRTWPRVLATVGEAWRPVTRAKWDAWAAGGFEDLKREDARACLQAASAFVASGTRAPVRTRTGRAPPSSYVRRRRLVEGLCVTDEGLVSSEDVLTELRAAPDAGELAEAGLRRALLAGQARALGLLPTAEEVARAEAEWWAQLKLPSGEREVYLATCGLDAHEVRRLCEERALEQLMLEHASRLLPDGPSWDEALATEARLRGRWVEEARQLGAPKPRRRKR
ncbi:TfuA-like protein [Archangium lansingense]|uniref:TfuA-like protein n=1 Tax=Archangium lansingense TaxID=2995310 RepID=UPI003B766DB0